MMKILSTIAFLLVMMAGANPAFSQGSPGEERDRAYWDRLDRHNDERHIPKGKKSSPQVMSTVNSAGISGLPDSVIPDNCAIMHVGAWETANPLTSTLMAASVGTAKKPECLIILGDGQPDNKSVKARILVRGALASNKDRVSLIRSQVSKRFDLIESQ